MNVFVCVKSVPESASIAFDNKTFNLVRSGNSAVLNPYDFAAVEAGLQCVERYGGRMGVVSMGPSSAESGLRTSLSMGANDAYLLQSSLFAGADVLATAYTLSAFFKSISGYDLIICGKHSADGDTGQTGAMIAKLLDIPHAAAVKKIDNIENRTANVWQRLDDSEQHVRLDLPCLIVVENDIHIPRAPSLSAVLHARKQKIHIKDRNSFKELDVSRCGTRGSATQVKRIFVLRRERKGQMLRDDDLSVLRDIIK